MLLADMLSKNAASLTAALFESMPELLQELAVEARDAIAGYLGELENELAGRDRFDNGENSAAGFHPR